MDIISGLRRLAFVMLSAAIVGVSSERMFWYWASDPLDHGIVAIVYAPAVAGVLWLISRYRVHDAWGVLLLAPVFGYLIEGVITPVVYSGGPFIPFFPVWFSFWHGVFGVVVLWYFFRKWLVAGERWKLLAVSAGLGAFWGMWAMTMHLPENLEDPELIADSGGALQILGPVDFAVYAFAFSGIVAGAHYLLGRGLWMTKFEPSRVVRWMWMLGTGAAVVAWTVAIPWAGPMFAVYMGLQLWALRRQSRSPSGTPILEALAGRVSLGALVPIVAMPILASSVHALLWHLDPAESAVRGAFMYGTIGVQTIVGGVLMVKSLRRAICTEPSGSPTRRLTGLRRRSVAV